MVQRRIAAGIAVMVMATTGLVAGGASAATPKCNGRTATKVGTSASETLNGTAGNDVIVALGGNDIIRGFGGSDVICGGPGNDQLFGGVGADRLEGGAGTDVIDGGSGTDTLSYMGAIKGVKVNMTSAVAQNTGGAGIDRLVSMENFVGSSYSDRAVGTRGDNTLVGGMGNDQLFGYIGRDLLVGGPGNDTLDGGGGNDTIDYSSAGGGVNVSLNVVRAQITHGAGTDTIAGVENLAGSRFADRLTGNNFGNYITGNGGNDVLYGLGGNDLLEGNAGANYADGGAGYDTCLRAAALNAIDTCDPSSLASDFSVIATDAGHGPCCLGSWDYATSSDFETVNGRTYADNKAYDSGFSIGADEWYSAEYNLGRHYKVLTATLGIEDTSDSTSQVRFDFYADNSLFKSYNVPFGVSLPVRLDITNVLRLQIRVTSLVNANFTRAVVASPVVSASTFLRNEKPIS